MRQISDNQYEQFTPEERAQLTFSALARNDEAEANRLWNTCPRYRYKMADIEYTQRVNLQILIGSVFFQKFVCGYNNLTKIEILSSEFLNDLEHEEEAGIFAFKDKISKLIKIADDAKIKCCVQLKSLYYGFERFCNEAGINHVDTLKSLSIEDACPDIDIILSSSLEATETDIFNSFEMFKSYWHF